MSNLILARRYSLALFELAEESAVVDKIAQELRMLKEVVSKNPAWVEIIDDATMPLRAKRKMIDEISKKLQLQEYVYNLFNILAERKKMILYSDISEAYESLVLEAKGLTTAVVTVANKNIWDALQEEITDTLKKVYGKEINLSCLIDGSIIGGLIIRTGDVVYDGSIRGELKRMKEKLLENTREL